MSFGCVDAIRSMGNNSSSRPDLIVDGEPDYSFADENSINRGTCIVRQPILKFHSVHGDNLSLTRAGKCARRKESFCKSLCFSNRPVLIDEIVCIKLSEVSNLWSGVLRFGVTSVDPASFRDIELPKFACPDLTSKSGFWAKALPERYCVQDTIVHFMVNSDGNLYYGINGLNKGVFLNRINVGSNLWAIFDIYGNTKQIEFIDPVTALPSEVQMMSRNALVPPDPVNDSNSTNNDTPLKFSRRCGPTVEVDSRGLLATRVGHEFSQAYVFTARPIKMEEDITIIVMKNTPEFMGSMAFGLTSCDPSTISDLSALPADSDNLLERPEYWVCIKNVAVNPRSGDICTFSVRQTGEVLFKKNEHSARTIMHVDTSVPLWAFFDLYGSTSKLRLANPNESQQYFPSNRSSSISLETPSSRVETLNSRLRKLAAVRVELPPPQINLFENRDNLDRESSEHNATNESTERVQSARLFGTSLPFESHTTTNSITNSSPTITSTSRPSPAVLDLMSSLAASAAERVALPPVSSNPIITRASTRSPLLLDSSLSSGLESLSLSDRDNLHRLTPTLGSSLRTPTTTTHRTALSSINLDTWERPASAPRSTSVNPRMDDSRLSCSPSNLTRFELPTTSSALSTSSSSNTSGPSSTDFVARTTDILLETKATTSTAAQNDSNQQSGLPASECVICMDDKVNCVLYRCGHMCLCIKCAKETMDCNGICPVCRAIIMDVIKIYHA